VVLARFEGWEEFAYAAIGCLLREYWVFFFIPECHSWDRFGLRREKGCDRPSSASATLVFHTGSNCGASNRRWSIECCVKLSQK